jgi:hypothetical protein
MEFLVADLSLSAYLISHGQRPTSAGKADDGSLRWNYERTAAVDELVLRFEAFPDASNLIKGTMRFHVPSRESTDAIDEEK